LSPQSLTSTAHSTRQTKNDLEIRVLILHPGQWDDNISCELQHARLNKTEYEALSYVWGDASDTRPILLHGYTKQVTANLESALRRLRKRSDQMVLWVDALCINQDDLAERSQQVTMMMQIFDSAKMVFWWLGEVPETMPKIHKDLLNIVHFWNKTKDLEIDSEGLLHLLKRHDLDFENIDWTGIWDLLERPFWTRMWIMQEFCTLRGVNDELGLLVCGNYRFYKGAFIIINGFIDKVSQGGPLIMGNSPAESKLGSVMRYRGQPPGRTMITSAFQIALGSIQHRKDALKLIYLTNKLEATDPRDKIFALLGIFNPIKYKFQADYTKSVSDVYKSFTQVLIFEKYGIEVLRANRSRRNQFSPTWCIPDYISEALQLTYHPYWDNFEKIYNASGGTESEISIDEDANILTCAGVRIGTVNRVIGPFYRKLSSPLEDSPPSMEELKFQEANDQLNSIVSEMIGHPLKLEELWRTMVMDCKLVSNQRLIPAPKELEHGFYVAFELAERPENMSKLKSDTLMHQFATFAVSSMTERCFFMTENGYMGIGPAASQVGDLAVVFLGGDFCFLIRPEDMGHYELVGDAYIQGLMFGEMIKRNNKGEIDNLENFKLC
jgi:Heterokaryon incompatibility protein (HET)